jgi:hypothetical protein
MRAHSFESGLLDSAHVPAPACMKTTRSFYLSVGLRSHRYGEAVGSIYGQRARKIGGCSHDSVGFFELIGIKRIKLGN